MARVATLIAYLRCCGRAWPLLLVTTLLAVKAACQVGVSVTLSKPEFLAGEPVFALAHVANVGPDAVGYSECDARVELAVAGRQTRQVVRLGGCFTGFGVGFSMCGIDHPPMLAPGKSTDFEYLLRDYVLPPGEYRLRVSGKAGVRWKFVSGLAFYPPRPRAPSKFHDGDAVPGAQFDEVVALRVKPASERELREVYAPLLSDAAALDQRVQFRARDAIGEMAPALLEKTIAGFADRPETARFAVKGLERIDTATSRADLVTIFDKSGDLAFRASVVEALAEMNSSDQLAFFASLLPGHASEIDDRVRDWAVLAIGRLGGDRGVEVLGSFLRTSGAQASPQLRATIATALASGQSKRAIPVLIELYSDSDGLVQNNVCGSLQSLTHRFWCSIPASETDFQSAWRRWWRKHEAMTRIYGVDQCPVIGKSENLDY